MHCSNCGAKLLIPGTVCPSCQRGETTVSSTVIVSILVFGLLMAAFSTVAGFFIVLISLALGLLYILEAIRQKPPELKSHEVPEETPFSSFPQQLFNFPFPQFGDMDSSKSTQIRVTWSSSDAPVVTVNGIDQTGGNGSNVERLQQLKEMHEQGLISAREFAEKRAEILKGL